MARRHLMRVLARWHIRLAWVLAVPLLLWTLSGLVMVARPIDEVRGENLRLPPPERPLPADTRIAVALPGDGTRPVRAVSTRMEQGEAVTRVTYMDGSSERFRADGSAMGPLTEIEARMIAAQGVRGGDRVASATLFDAQDVPLDFRRPEAVWQIVLDDGTHVYVGRDTAEIEAIRTRWWRFFDVMWGLHIMDLKNREDTHHPLLIGFAALAFAGTLMGAALLFRRRRARPAGL